MKAICNYWSGNSFDSKKGEIVEISELYISAIWRNGNEVNITDSNKGANPTYLLPQQEIQQMVQIGDKLEDNYCHGQYEVIAD